MNSDVRGIRAALAALAIYAAAVPGPAAEKAMLTVSSSMPDGSAEPRYPYQRATLAETFAERISLREHFAARAVKAPRWQEVPEGIDARNHVSLVHVHLGTHHDFLAFLHGGPQNSLRKVARAEAIDRSDVQYWFSIPTGPHQIDRNAAIDLIAHFANQYPGAEGEGPVVTMRLETRQAKAGESDLAMPADVDVRSLLPVLTGAACAAGLRPTFEKVPDTLTVKLTAAPGANACDIEATLICKQQERVRACRQVMFGDMFDTAHVLFRALLHWQGAVLDFARVSDASVQPLAIGAAQGGPLVVLEEGEALCGRSLVNGEAVWRMARPKTDRADWLFVRQLGVDGRIRLYAGRLELAHSVDPATGEAKALPAKPKDALSLAEYKDTMAITGDRAVRVFAGGKPRWEKETARPVVAGPAINAQGVFYADAEGTVVALAAADGRELWRASLPSPAAPRLAATDASLLVATRSGTLLALGGSDGKALWQAEIGDGLRQAPQRADGSLLIASGANRLLVLDEQTGRSAAQRKWPTWLLSAEVVNGPGGRRVVCVDGRRRITVLAWPSLETRREITLPNRPSPGILECPALPIPWGARSEAADAKHDVALVGDERGYLYAIRLED